MKKSLRKPDWDYGQTACYMVTISLAKGSQLFGTLINKRVHLNAAGLIAKECIDSIPDHFPNVQLDEFVVMPDHVHVILHFKKTSVSTKPATFGPQKNNLGSVIRGLKSAITSRLKDNFPGFKWLRGYHDTILFTSIALENARRYVINNPKNSPH